MGTRTDCRQSADSCIQTTTSGLAVQAVARQSIDSNKGLQEYPLWSTRRIIRRRGRGSGSTTSSLWAVLPRDLPLVAQRRQFSTLVWSRTSRRNKSI